VFGSSSVPLPVVRRAGNSFRYLPNTLCTLSNATAVEESCCDIIRVQIIDAGQNLLDLFQRNSNVAHTNQQRRNAAAIQLRSLLVVMECVLQQGRRPLTNLPVQWCRKQIASEDGYVVLLKAWHKILVSFCVVTEG